VLKEHLKQEGSRKNLAVKRADGSDLFLFLMRDVHITPYHPRKYTHPYLQELPQPTKTAEPEVAVPDNPWNGRTELSDWRNVRDEALARDGYRCIECRGRENLDVHHIKSRRKGGTDALENLVTLCEKCHVARGGYGRPRKNE
jgi:5-methylcytosine-specific restriction endonuclease McrA